jgi:preprotein translocase subunit YajC
MRLSTVPSTLFAQDNGSSGGGAALFQLLFFALIGVGMYFLLIRPQRRRMREQQSLLSSLGENDEIITTGGIYGFITAIDGDVLWVDIADGVEIRIHRSAVARKIDPAKESAGGHPAPAAADDEPADDAARDAEK